MGAEQTKEVGYQIGRVVPNSPAHLAGLVPFFDFIQIVDGNDIAARESHFFREYLTQSTGKMIKLEVYNSKTQGTREVFLTPNSTWGGQGLLGCSINWETMEKALSFAWHILDVCKGSNAERAGFQSYRDYIVGMQGIAPIGAKNAQEVFITMFQDPADFHRRLDSRMEAAKINGHPQFNNISILFLLYDCVANDMREVVCDFPLGCEIGNGYLHQIPFNKGDPRNPTIRHFYTAPAPAPAPSPMPALAPGQPEQAQPQLMTPQYQPQNGAPQQYTQHQPAVQQPALQQPAVQHISPQTAPQYQQAPQAQNPQMGQQYSPNPQPGYQPNPANAQYNTGYQGQPVYQTPPTMQTSPPTGQPTGQPMMPQQGAPQQNYYVPDGQAPPQYVAPGAPQGVPPNYQGQTQVRI